MRVLKGYESCYAQLAVGVSFVVLDFHIPCIILLFVVIASFGRVDIGASGGLLPEN